MMRRDTEHWTNPISTTTSKPREEYTAMERDTALLKQSNTNTLVHLVAEYYDLALRSEKLYHKHTAKRLQRKISEDMKNNKPEPLTKLMGEVKYDKHVEDMYNQIMQLQKKNEQLRNLNKTQKAFYETKIDKLMKERLSNLVEKENVEDDGSTADKNAPNDAANSQYPLRKTIHLLTPRKPMRGEEKGPNGFSIDNDSANSGLKTFRNILNKKTIFDRSMDDILVPTRNSSNSIGNKPVDKGNADTSDTENNQSMVIHDVLMDVHVNETATNGNRIKSYDEATFNNLINLNIPKSATPTDLSSDNNNSFDSSKAGSFKKKRKLSKNKVINVL